MNQNNIAKIRREGKTCKAGKNTKFPKVKAEGW